MPYSLLRERCFVRSYFGRQLSIGCGGSCLLQEKLQLQKQSPGRAKTLKKLPFLRRPWEDQRSSTELWCPTWSHIVPRRANSLEGNGGRERGKKTWMSLYICSRVVDVDPSSISNWNFCHLHLLNEFLFFWTRSQEKSVEKSGPEAENWRDMLMEVYEELKAWSVRLRNLLALVKQGGTWKPSLLWSDPSFWLFKK